MASVIASGHFGVLLGSRILGKRALAGELAGPPRTIPDAIPLT
jgi:hypothetical protein